MEHAVYFAHGKESGPWGIKIQALARIAKDMGFRVESPDYSGLADPEHRVVKLLSLKPSAQGRLVLAGSSMGGYVAAAASETLKPDGLFLMAPAVLLPGFGRADLQPCAQQSLVVHGWQDEVIPTGKVIQFCRQHKIELHLLNDKHSLHNVLPTIEILFRHFLHAVLSEKA